jgi:hypothetical protein
LYSFRDTTPDCILSQLELHNFISVAESGEFTITQAGDDINDLVDLLIEQLEQRYIAGTYIAYNKELSNGYHKH